MIEFILMKVQKNNALFLFIIFIFLFIFWNNNFDLVHENNEIFSRQNNNFLQAEFIRVVDGDTIILKINKKKERVRLVGLNTPESKKINGRVVECFGKEATEQADKILKDKIIYFEPNLGESRDKYGRLLGYIFVKDENTDFKKNFSQIMIASGYGYEYTYKGIKYKYQNNFKKAQKNAQKYQLGLWSDETCNY